MRIAIDTRPLQLSSKDSGTGVYIRNLVEAISRLDHRNHYILISLKTRESSQLNLCQGFFHQYLELDCPPLEHLNVIRDKIFLHRELSRQDLDIIHFPAPFELKLFFDTTSCPTVVTILDMTPVHFADRVFVGKRKILQPLYNMLMEEARKAHHTIVISQNTGQDVEKIMKIPPEKITTTHLGKSDKFRPIDNENYLKLIRHTYNLPRHFILYVGGFSLHKNLPALIEAMDILSDPDHYSNLIPLVIAGKMDRFFRDHLLELVRARRLEERVIFTGFVALDHLPGLYNLAEAFVLPSLYEGFGLPVLEAMACGIPVACSRTSSLPEVAGEAACYFDPENPSQIADCLNQITKDQDTRKRLRESGLEQARKFTWEKTAQMTLEVYEKLGGKKD